MPKFIDLTGKRFGRLTVIRRSYLNNNKTYWLCKCDCGAEKIIRRDKLRSGNTKSCGCLQKEVMGNMRRMKVGFGNMRKAIRNYKRSARMRGIGYNLTEGQFKEITQKDCFYCGVKPNQRMKSPKSNGDYIYNGIDRVDNNKGYTIDNVVPCCGICNFAKHRLTTQEFKDWIERIYIKMFV